MIEIYTILNHISVNYCLSLLAITKYSLSNRNDTIYFIHTHTHLKLTMINFLITRKYLVYVPKQLKYATIKKKIN